jgi:hypothetical protein
LKGKAHQRLVVYDAEQAGERPIVAEQRRPAIKLWQHPVRDADEVGVVIERIGALEDELDSTRFDGRLPVTLRTARQVADIIKHLGPDDQVEPNYGYYM